MPSRVTSKVDASGGGMEAVNSASGCDIVSKSIGRSELSKPLSFHQVFDCLLSYFIKGRICHRDAGANNHSPVHSNIDIFNATVGLRMKLASYKVYIRLTFAILYGYDVAIRT